MFIVTFYSYKGGVGRTLALVNCAFRLARQGKKVFILDFDLEAPGIDSFRSLHDDTRTNKGIVEYIDRFRTGGEVEDVTEYVCEADSESTKPGKIWFMPAGRKDEAYQALLSKLDWKYFYQQQKGYLFVENLKATIESEYSPDYVLVDSRTGLTDVSGICTLQMPHLVVLLFSLNNQNVLGIKQIYRSIRDNKLARDIKTCLVASPIPDVPDYFKIRRERIDYAQKTIGAEKISLILPFDPFVTFEETVLPSGEQSTYLAKSYDRLAETIRKENKEDLLTRLEAANEIRDRGDVEEAEGKYRDILNDHPDDVSTLLTYSRLLRFRHRRDALKYLNRAITLAPRNEEVLQQLIRTYVGLGQIDRAATYLDNFLSVCTDADDIESLASLFETNGALEPTRRLYERAVELAKSPSDAPNLDLGNVYRGLGKLDLAIEQYEKAIKIKPYSLIENFNLGHALHTRRDPRGIAYLERAIQLFERHPGGGTSAEKSNAFQAMSHAYAAVGKVKIARQLLAQAIKTSPKRNSSTVFSSVQYKHIPAMEFVKETRHLMASLDYNRMLGKKKPILTRRLLKSRRHKSTQ